MDKSEDSHAILDEESRQRKSNKIITVLQNQCDLESKRVLDIGTGSGYIAQALSKVAEQVTSVDVLDERQIEGGYEFIQVEDEELPFDDKSFDIVISNHVVEHVPAQQKHIDEAARVLKDGGLVYLATPNKYFINDPHYKLPFISWLPRKVSDSYLKLFSDHDWDIYPLSYWGIQRLASNKFRVHNATLDIVKNPEQYHLKIFKPAQVILKRLPQALLKVVNLIIPTYIVVLEKNNSV